MLSLYHIDVATQHICHVHAVPCHRIRTTNIQEIKKRQRKQSINFISFSFQSCFSCYKRDLVAVSVVLAPLLGIKLDQSVDSHNRHASLDSTLELLDLAHARLEHTRLDAVVHAALGEVEAVVAVALGLGDGFRVGV